MAGNLITYTDVPQNGFITVNLPRPAYGVLIENNANVSVTLRDDAGRDADVCPQGLTLGWNHGEGLYAPAIGCVGTYQGRARVYFFDGNIDLTNNPAAILPPTNAGSPPIPMSGTVSITGPITITSGTVNIGNPVSIAAGQTVNVGSITTMPAISGAVSITGGTVNIGNPVSIAAGQTVNIGTFANAIGISGTVTLAAGQTINIGNPITIAAGQSVNIGSIVNTVTIANSIIEANTTILTGLLPQNVSPFTISTLSTGSFTQTFSEAVSGFSLSLSMKQGSLTVYYGAVGQLVYLKYREPYLYSDNSVNIVEEHYDAPIPAGGTVTVQIEDALVATTGVLKW